MDFVDWRDCWGPGSGSLSADAAAVLQIAWIRFGMLLPKTQLKNGRYSACCMASVSSHLWHNP